MEDKRPEFDCRRYRQFAVTVYIDIQNVLGHLLKVGKCMNTVQYIQYFDMYLVAIFSYIAILYIENCLD